MKCVKWMVMACLGLTMLAGCGGGTEEAAAPAGGTAPEAEAPAAAGGDETATAEASAAGDDGKILIGLSFDSLSIERWQRDRDYFVAKAKELGAECVFQSAEGDARQQNAQCETLLAQGVDALVIVPKSATAAARAVDAAKAQGVPVVCYDRLIMNCEPDVYVSFDSVRVGRMQAQALIDKTDGKGKYFLLGGDPGDHNAHLLRQGQEEALAPHVESGAIEIIGKDWAIDWSPKSAREIMENVLVSHGTDIDAIVASHDGTASGAIQALKQQGLEGKVEVSGQDADLEGSRRVLRGTQAITVYKPLKALAERAAEITVKLAKGEEIEAETTINNEKVDVPAVFLEPIPLSQDNVLEVLVGDNFYTEEQLRAGE